MLIKLGFIGGYCLNVFYVPHCYCFYDAYDFRCRDVLQSDDGA
jgi:hypothetical protein